MIKNEKKLSRNAKRRILRRVKDYNRIVNLGNAIKYVKGKFSFNKVKKL